MKNNQAGKGDKPRPIADRKLYDNNYDRIFDKCALCKGRCEVGKLKSAPCELRCVT